MTYLFIKQLMHKNLNITDLALYEINVDNIYYLSTKGEQNEKG